MSVEHLSATCTHNPPPRVVITCVLCAIFQRFSRKVIWLKVMTTNNDPSVILLPYLLSVLQNNGCPSIVRSDHGTENTTLAACHMALRHSHDDKYSGDKSFRFGPSTTNTRIESWWAQLRNSVTDWWINMFKDLIQEGNFNPQDIIHRHCIGYVYEPLLNKALEDFKERWNSHRIRQNRVAGCPPDIPDDLYHLPQMNGVRSYK
ncbi:uncharacterized protein [Dysidea avara]|uniref:uncharacterized protein isoform X1 n=2 Tax=Dysidea avara TaxID=196820 RepID=UPI00331EF4D9